MIMKQMKQIKRSTHIYCVICGISAENYNNPICWKCKGNLFTYVPFITLQQRRPDKPLI